MQTLTFKNLDRAKTAEYVKKIAEEGFGRKVLAVKCMGGGSYGLAYKVDFEGESVVIKAFKAAGMHISEARQLRELIKYCPVPIPKVHFVFDAVPELPIDGICMEFMHGENVFTYFPFIFYSRKKKQAFAEAVADALIALHGKTKDKFGELDITPYENWLDYYQPFAHDVLKDALELNRNGDLDEEITEIMVEAYDSFSEIFSEKVEKASLIHGDLNVMNIFADKKSLQPTAFIDPLDCMYADREYDLFQFNNYSGKFFGLYKAYKAKQSTSTYCDVKVAFYGLFHQVAIYIKTGVLFKFIMNPLLINMNKQLKLIKRK